MTFTPTRNALRFVRPVAVALGLLLLVGAPAKAAPTSPTFFTGYYKAVDTRPSDAMHGATAEVYLAEVEVRADGTSPDVGPADALDIVVKLGGDWFALHRPTFGDSTFVGQQVTRRGALTRRSGAIDLLNGNRSGSTSSGTSNGASLKMTTDGTMSWRVEFTDSQGNAEAFRLQRRVLIPHPEAGSFDAGPTGVILRHLDTAPLYPDKRFPNIIRRGRVANYRNVYWRDWGAVFYRGRLDGSARVLLIASDPGPTECLPMVRRSLVGDAGQRVQGFVHKLGLTESYVMVNAFTYATHPSRLAQGRRLFLDFPEQLEWRHKFWDMIFEGGNLQGVMTFGGNARAAFSKWKTYRKRTGRPLPDDLVIVTGMHPSGPRGGFSANSVLRMTKQWREAIHALRQVVTPDDPARAELPNYGVGFTEVDYGRVPPADLPEAAQQFPWIGDDSWGRFARPKHNNPAKRRGNYKMDFITPPASLLQVGDVTPNEAAILELLNDTSTTAVELNEATKVDGYRGIGISRARLILAHPTAFSALDDVVVVRGVGPKTIERLWAIEIGASAPPSNDAESKVGIEVRKLTQSQIEALERGDIPMTKAPEWRITVSGYGRPAWPR